ncbi:TetR/AcrR family transcriptional regulator [Cupriavidus taiwanensis]|uniref:TetR/AcrR family transcriptional regulator n=1 Tax=Cupriavidus taiwanensis TaxID=164546 RepID=UPI000E10BA7A|nr:TetR/AcrR family transcriptional regulator [Cupriavidus taiwanensis]SOY61391.1 putative transcriptional regulator, TetR family [Cupriavidus taiwanensis]SOY73900.1 putative transcriptional regulator, TetR family [Cupriavidus taiwanensis]SOY97884.1 putative transcriptional regulator, TetR family [Cupriavidus taiwanensis]SOZ67713.1 putative transcriptional regulator, TetR family [Cupriavidus taiwanensis]SOZ84804.1 putative transcriptional regulator, TetR family [Cupriavidus taiwanensis]
MARASREQTNKNREAIEQASSRLFRERGLNGVSVAELMAGAGLTHGGFYGHFASKDALAAQACKRAFEESTARWERRLARAGGDRKAMLANLVEPYLTAAHCAHPGVGCAAAALAVDVAREPAGKPVRQAYAEGLRTMIDDMAQTVASDDPQQRHDQALVRMALLVGALTLARATEGDPLSDEMLNAVRAHLLGSTG